MKNPLVHQELPHKEQGSPSLNPRQNPISPDMERQINELYAKKNLEVESIDKTPYEGLVYVNVQGKQNIVDLNGFHPQILTQKEINELPVLKERTEVELPK